MIAWFIFCIVFSFQLFFWLCISLALATNRRILLRVIHGYMLELNALCSLHLLHHLPSTRSVHSPIIVQYRIATLAYTLLLLATSSSKWYITNRRYGEREIYFLYHQNSTLKPKSRMCHSSWVLTSIDLFYQMMSSCLFESFANLVIVALYHSKHQDFSHCWCFPEI